MEKRFRVWDKLENKFIEIERLTGRTPEEYFHSNYVLGFDGKIYLVNGKGWFIEAKNLIIQQFTGLKAIKGKEICEGDIVKPDWNEKIKGEVYFGEEGLWCVKWNKEGKEAGYNYRAFAFEKFGFEVVGNINGVNATDSAVEGQ